MLLWAIGIISTLGLVGTVAAVILVPGVAVPLLQRVTVAILKCKPCMLVLAAIALLFAGALYGVHVERQAGDARIERLKKAAAAAADDRDSDIRADLERHYKPKLSTLEERTKTLQGEVEKYEKSLQAEKPAPAPGGRCELGAGPLRLRQPR